MKFFFKLICFTLIYYGILCSTNLTSKRPTEDDYYLNYDYDILQNSTRIIMKSESLILPVPDNRDTKFTIDILPEVELPDDSLADTDLRDHDFIDNLMYVYYGSHNKSVRTYGPEIIIIGSVFSCAAQLLTIFIVLLRKNANGKRESNSIFLQLMGCFCFSNLIFMLGVYATKNPLKCQIIALVLYYLHLLTAFWIFIYVYYIYRRFCNAEVPKLQFLHSIAYGVPVMLTSTSYIICPNSYETKKFCFVSVQKGMIINYMLPISALIFATTLYSLNGIRKMNNELMKFELNSSADSLNALRGELEISEDRKVECSDSEFASLRECKRCLKSLCIVQSSYDIVWFVAVLALENINYSNSMAIVYSITSTVLNWYIFARTRAFTPTIINSRLKLVEDSTVYSEKIIVSNELMASRGSSDSVPLLISSETEMREIIRNDYISTISS